MLSLLRMGWRRKPEIRTCAACGGKIFHATLGSTIVPLNAEPEIRYLVPDIQKGRSPKQRPYAVLARTYTGHIETCPRRREKLDAHND